MGKFVLQYYTNVKLLGYNDNCSYIGDKVLGRCVLNNVFNFENGSDFS